MSQVTSWFKGPTPVRAGVYQVLINGKVKYARWGGDQWHLALPSFELAKDSCIRSLNCYAPRDFGGWRGLAKEPK